MNFEIFIKYPAVFFTGFLAAYILTPLVRLAAKRCGIVDLPDARRIHSSPTPRGGGLAVFLAFHAACAVIFLFPWSPFSGVLNRAWWLNFLPVSALLLICGLIDDAFGMRAIVKLLWQTVAAVLFYCFCGVHFGKAFGVELPAALDLLGVLLWMLVITNAFNLIDGLDGLASGLAILGALGLAGSLVFRHLPGDALVCIGLIGACLAFLRYNFHPASIFLGDSGSMFLGFTLSALALSTTSKSAAMASLGVPLLAVGVPVFDVVLAVWRRTARRLSRKPAAANNEIMQADLEHLHHRLFRSGASQSATALILYTISAALISVALLGMAYRTYSRGIFLIAFAAGAYFMVKHLVRVELWDSAAAIHSGLRRKTAGLLPIVLYPATDACILALGLWLAIFLAFPSLGTRQVKLVWVETAPVWIGISFMAIFFSRSYSIIWLRARASDITALCAALMTGILLSLGFSGLIGNQITRQSVLAAVLFMGLTVPSIAASRLFFQTAQDLMALGSRHPAITGKRKFRNFLLYGAGMRCALFLRQRADAYPEIDDDRRIIGLIDDDPGLHDRMVYGFKIMGGSNKLAEIVPAHDIAGIIIAAELRNDARRRLTEFAKEQSLELTQWRAEETKIL